MLVPVLPGHSVVTLMPLSRSSSASDSLSGSTSALVDLPPTGVPITGRTSGLQHELMVSVL